MQKRVAIVGAGASGLLCAIFCAKAGLKVTLFEQNSKCAKKILVSGNGRCNITNRNLSSQDYFSENPSFVTPALQAFGFEDFKKFNQEIGLVLNVLEDGRAYPLSNEAKSVARIYEEYARALGVIIKTDTKITDIKKLIKEYASVVIATGSRAAQHLGGNSDGEDFARACGHSIIPAYPTLVQLHLKSKIASKMSGTKINAAVTLLINQQKELTLTGDVLFTNYGVSGFAILDLSQRASLGLLHYEAVSISLNLLPDFTMQTLATHLSKVASQIPLLTLVDILVGLVPLKIAHGVLDSLNLSHSCLAKELHTKLAKKIANTLLNWRFEVSDTHGFRHAEVSGGGINTDEVDAHTMMSKKCKNLYFCGEVLDVVGKRGGYNFAFAWASAYLGAKSIIKVATH